MWQRTKTGSKYGFDKLWGYADKLGAPVNKLSNKLGSEAFWPTTLDKESDKAARILRSFCKDGFYQEEPHQKLDGPKQKQRVLKKIPAQVIREAQGLAIFTTMRTGLWVSGAGGSGVLVGRMEDGSWSPPTGIMLHTAGLGFLVGVDIYDCVLVINTKEALSAFSRWRATVGGEISAVAGPVGVGGYLETEVHKRQAPIFTYLKSRGFYAGVQIDGTVVIERTDENERYYCQKLSALEIMRGKVRHPPLELRTLSETLKAAQGDVDIDQSLLPSEPPPADYHVVEEGYLFGVPDREDPDPFGVLALEKEGMVIKDAGTKVEAPISEFDFRPRVESPVFSTLRRSFESTSHASTTDWRRSTLSTNTESRYLTSDMSTQTDLDARSTSSPGLTSVGTQNQLVDDLVLSNGALGPSVAGTEQKQHDRIEERRDDDDEEDDEFEYDSGEDDGAVHEVQQAAAPQFITRARLVTLPQRLPPKLPDRNPFRARTANIQESSGATSTWADRGVSLTSSSEREISVHSTKSSFSNDGHSEGVPSPASSPDRILSFLYTKSTPTPEQSSREGLLTNTPSKSASQPAADRPPSRVISLSQIRQGLGSDGDE